MQSHTPLAGVKVLSFEGVFSLPSGTRLLTDLGADVVRVPSPGRMEQVADRDPSLMDIDVLMNKRSIRIDVKNARGHELALRLVGQADVVCSNFRPGVMARLGLDEDSLRAANPRVILLELSGFGAPGPWTNFPVLGPSVEAAGGMSMLIGTPDLPPMRIGTDIYADLAAGRYAVLGILAGLSARRETGEGRSIDVSMYETVVSLIGDKVLGALASGRHHPRLGNRSATIAPQGIYPSRGDDEWVAISVETDDQWRRLVDIVGADALETRRGASAAERLSSHDEIDFALSTWTQSRDKDEVAQVLQAAGVPAGPVQRPADVVRDPQHAARGLFQDVPDHATRGTGSHPHFALPWQAVGYSRAVIRKHEADGGSADSVLADWLGLDADEVESLVEGGAVVRVAPAESMAP